MSKNYAVVRTDNMSGTDDRSQLVSIRYMGDDGETPTAIENGNVLLVKKPIQNADNSYQREIRVGAKPAANSPLNEIVLIATPELLYDERLKALDDFRNEADGAPARGYRLHNGDQFSVTKGALDGKSTPAVGDVVELKAATKLNVAASLTSNSTQVGIITGIETVGPYTYYCVTVGETA